MRFAYMRQYAHCFPFVQKFCLTIPAGFRKITMLSLLLLAPRVGVVGMLWAAPIADVLSVLLALVLVRSEMRRLTALEQRAAA